MRRWSDWIHFFASGVGASARSTHARVDALLAWRDDALDIVRRARVSGLAERSAADVIGMPIIVPAHVARDYAVTPQAARNALRRLVGLGLLAERTRGGRLVFSAETVIDLIRHEQPMRSVACRAVSTLT